MKKKAQVKKRRVLKKGKNRTKNRRKKMIWILAAVLAVTVAVLLLYVFVFSIRAIEIQNETGVDGRRTFIRYEEDIQEQLRVEVVADNELALKKLKYSSDHPELVEVSEDGVLTAKNPGDAVITVQTKYNPWVKAEFLVTVIQKAVRMEVAMPSELPSNECYTLLHTGDRPAMELKPYPDNALVENLIFHSENPEIVTVTEEGILEAHKTGITVIEVSWVGPYTERGKTEFLGGFMVNVCREKGHDTLADHELKWYDKSCLIAHALGNAGEYIYTNTKDALEESIAEGYKTLEVDLSLTSDKEVVCRHTWYSDDFEVSYGGIVPDLAAFVSEKYFGVLTPLTGKELLEIWAEHPELYFVTDVKQDENTNLLEVLERFVELAKETGHEDLLEHLVIQAYHIEDYDKVNQIYPFENWLFTIYQLPEDANSRIEAAAFAAEHGFGVLVAPSNCMGDNFFMDLAEKYGLTLFIHTVNEPEVIERIAPRGVYGYYSDFFIPNELKENGEK